MLLPGALLAQWAARQSHNLKVLSSSLREGTAVLLSNVTIQGEHMFGREPLEAERVKGWRRRYACPQRALLEDYPSEWVDPQPQA